MKKAFSLFELLIVLAIIGILIALTVPAIRGTTVGSRRAKCSSFQKQLLAAAAAYRTDYGVNVPAVSYIQDGTSTTMRAWDDEEALWQYLDAPAQAMICPNHVISTGSITGYNYNTSFIGDEDYLFGDAVKGVTPSECKHPASCAMFGDCSKNKFMRSPEIDVIYDPYTDLDTRCAGMQSYRHQDATIVAWLDGHVSVHSTRFNTCDDDPVAGFLSADNNAYDPRVIVITKN